MRLASATIRGAWRGLHLLSDGTVSTVHAGKANLEIAALYLQIPGLKIQKKNQKCVSSKPAKSPSDAARPKRCAAPSGGGGEVWWQGADVGGFGEGRGIITHYLSINLSCREFVTLYTAHAQ